MKQKLTILLFLVASCATYAQQPSNSILVSGSLKVTPIELHFGNIGYHDGFPPIYFSEQEQLTGLEMGMILRHEFKKIGSWMDLSSSLKYDHLYFDIPVLPTQVGIHESVKSLLIHVALDFSKGFKLNNITPFVSLGFGFNNLGSEFATSYFIGGLPTDPQYQPRSHSFVYHTMRLGLGVRKGNNEVYFMGHLTDKNPLYYSEMLILEMGLRHRIKLKSN
ncbi:MAG: hypothetical protein U9N86_04805 [Bacteroidota bacterium]|nr:hypothetical protein [Bacteroidota bacterium]